jgi:hypothetical protein
LETSALISKLSNSVETEINDFLTNSVVSTGEIVSGILLSGDELFRVEKLAVGTSANFINDCGFQIEENAARDMLSGTGLGEEGVEGVIAAANSFVRGHLAIRLDTVFETEEFPAGVTYLDSGLTDVD